MSEKYSSVKLGLNIFLYLQIMTSQINLYAYTVRYCHSTSISPVTFEVSLIPSRQQLNTVDSISDVKTKNCLQNILFSNLHFEKKTCFQ